MKLKPYPEYKESGVPWLGKVPGHWEVLRNKYLLKELDDRSATGDEELLTVSHYTGITKRRSRLTNDNELLTNASSLVGYKKVKPNNFVMNIMLAWNGSQGTSPYSGIVSPAYCVFSVNEKKLSPKYLHFLHRSPFYTAIFKTASTGVIESRLRLYPEQYFRLPTAFPPLKEQTQIARFLDHKSSQISRFILAKKRMMELLKEQKQAIINDAVTGKIDVRTGKPYPKYKESSVEWLGKVPEEWEVRKIKHIAKMKSGDSITSMSIEDKGEYPVYGGNGLRGYYSKFTHDGEFLLVGRQGALCGNIHYVSGKFWASEHAVVTTVITDCSKKWFYYLLTTMNLNQYSESAAQPGISVEKIQNLRTLYPPKEEQFLIVTLIEKNIVNLDLAISRAEREISLIQEYRTRLIADVVTGKVDVRDIVVPETAEEDIIEADSTEDAIEPVEEEVAEPAEGQE